MSDVKSFIDPAQLAADLDINPANINEALQRHASLYVYYATLAVKARKQFDLYKLRLEMLEAELDKLYRAELKEANPKVTEAQIRAELMQDARWKSANAALIAAKEQLGYAENAQRGFEQRRETLLMIARNLAREQEGPLRVLANQEAADARARFLAAAARGDGA